VVNAIALCGLLLEIVRIAIIVFGLIVLRSIFLQLQLLLYVVQVVLVHMRKKILRGLLLPTQQLRRSGLDFVFGFVADF
jgi:hypothetical protein